jgi:hypothetical protein
MEKPLTFNAQINFPALLVGVKNYDGICHVIRNVLTEMKERGNQKVGFVSGPVDNSDDSNPEVKRAFMKANMERMRKYTKKLQEKNTFPTFASTDIFDSAWNDLEETNFSPEERKAKTKELFRTILASGVTDIYMIEGWRESDGAKDEFKAAKELALEIHDLDPKKQT